MRLSGTGNNCGNGRRKISIEACEALLIGIPYKKSNTRVEPLSGDKRVWLMKLFGNTISYCIPATDRSKWYPIPSGAPYMGGIPIPEYLQICDGQHQSMTTKERLNTLPNVNIYQKDYQWYLNGWEWRTGLRYNWEDIIVDYKPVDFSGRSSPVGFKSGFTSAPVPTTFLTEEQVQIQKMKEIQSSYEKLRSKSK